ncbi:MAG: hypothetical protein ACIAQ0_02835 [Phycisphaerales bacterium JB058]
MEATFPWVERPEVGAKEIPSRAEVQLDAEDVILLILEGNERLLGKRQLQGITRLEKLVFLLQRETDFEGIATLFVFKPYLFGPFSEEVQLAVNFLEGIHLIEVSVADLERSESELDEDFLTDVGERRVEYRYELTDKGRRVAAMWRSSLPRSDLDAIDTVVRRYGTMRLSQLIRYVYRKYPKTTSKSIHPEARRNQ